MREFILPVHLFCLDLKWHLELSQNFRNLVQIELRESLLDRIEEVVAQLLHLADDMVAKVVHVGPVLLRVLRLHVVISVLQH